MKIRIGGYRQQVRGGVRAREGTELRQAAEGHFFSTLDLEGGEWLDQVVRGSRQGEEDLVDNPLIRAGRNSDGVEGGT